MSEGGEARADFSLTIEFPPLFIEQRAQAWSWHQQPLNITCTGESRAQAWSVRVGAWGQSRLQRWSVEDSRVSPGWRVSPCWKCGQFRLQESVLAIAGVSPGWRDQFRLQGSGHPLESQSQFPGSVQTVSGVSPDSFRGQSRLQKSVL